MILYASMHFIAFCYVLFQEMSRNYHLRGLENFICIALRLNYVLLYEKDMKISLHTLLQTSILCM